MGKRIHQQIEWSLLGTEVFSFLLFFPFCRNRKKKKKIKLYIANIETRKQLAASNMHLYFRFRALILFLQGPVLFRQNTHRDQ